MKIGQYIYSKLSATTAVTDLVGAGIYPIYLPQNATYPAIVYMADNTPHTNTKTQAADLDKTNVIFHIWAEGAQGQDAYALLNDIEDALRDTLDYNQDTAGGITVVDCQYQSSKDGRDDEMTLFMREVTYTFITRNP